MIKTLHSSAWGTGLIPDQRTKIPHAVGEANIKKKKKRRGVGNFPGGPVVKNVLANTGDKGSIPGLGRSHVPWSN